MSYSLPGKTPNLDADFAARFGEIAARIHHAGASLPGIGRLSRLDVESLVAAPLRHLEPLIGTHPEWPYLQKLAERLAEEIRSIEARLSFGLCHGDLHGGNTVTDEHEVGVFDFEFCGAGFHSYDLSVFRCVLEIHTGEQAEHLWGIFCSAYDAARPLAPLDRAATGPFVLARHLWHLGLEAQLAPGAGFDVIGTDELDRYLSYFHIWDRQFIETQGPARSR